MYYPNPAHAENMLDNQAYAWVTTAFTDYDPKNPLRWCKGYRLRKKGIEYASNPSTAPYILTLLAETPIKEIREAVAYNQNTPPEVLATLAQDEDWRVRWAAVAGNKNTPHALLSKLSKDEDRDVRASGQR